MSADQEIRFAVFRSTLDHRKIRMYLDDVIEGRTQYESPEVMACDLCTRCLAGEFYPDRCIKPREGC